MVEQVISQVNSSITSSEINLMNSAQTSGDISEITTLSYYTYKGHSDQNGDINTKPCINTKPVLWYHISNVGPNEYPLASYTSEHGEEIYVDGIFDSAKQLWSFDFSAADGALSAGSNYIVFVKGGVPGEPNFALCDTFIVLAEPTATAIVENFSYSQAADTGDHTITLNGTVTNDFFQSHRHYDNKLAIYQEEQFVGYATVNSDGTWSYTVPNGLENNLSVLNFTTVVENAAGFTGSPSANFVIDVHSLISVTDLNAEDANSVIDGNHDFALSSNDHHTLLYERIDMNDATGGNGNDIANGFTVGNFNTNANADRIDFSGLLIGYQAGTSNISDFISVRQQGSNTVISVDLDGNGNQFASADILTLTNVQTDLNTLIQNQQIIV